MKQKKSKSKNFVRCTIIIAILFILGNQIHFYFENPMESKEIVPHIEKKITESHTSYNDVSALKMASGTIEDRLENLSLKDERIKTVLEQKEKYPEELLDALSRNIELLDLCLEYPEKKGKSFADTIGEIKEEIPLLFQWDKRWGYTIYKDNILGINGCGPTALAMVIAGLKKDNSITPSKIAFYAEKNGYYVNGVGTSWSLMTKGVLHFGIKSEELPLDKNRIINTLKKGEPIICAMGKGDFTLTGHFIVLVGVEEEKIKIHDPNSKARSTILWDYERIAPQIRNLWSFSKIK